MYNIPLILNNNDIPFLDKTKKYINFIETTHNFYIYCISVDCNYFHENMNLGLDNIPDSVKNDVVRGLCHIIIYMGDDGYSGSSDNHGGVDNNDLEIIESWRIKNRFPEYSIHFFSMNLIISEIVKKKDIKIMSYPMYYNSHLHIISPFDVSSNDFFDIGIPEKFDYKLFLNYNRNPHKHRMYFVLKLIENSLLNDGIVSFSDLSEDYQKYDLIHLKLNSNIPENIFDKLESLIPLKIDNLHVHNNDKNLGKILIEADYKKTFFSVVSETLTLNDTVYISEKTIKPLSIGHPFFLVSSKNSLKKVKEMGYKTFDRWWDESYDLCETYEERIEMILFEIKKLKLKSYTELVDIRKDMHDVLYHNQQIFKKIYLNEENPVFDKLNQIYNSIKK